MRRRSATVAIDVDAAVTNALREPRRSARARARTSRTPRRHFKLASNQKLPDVRLNASYQASGLGGTQVLRTGGFPGTIVGPGNVTGFGSVLDQLFRSDYPTWAVGVSVSYPIGQSAEEANYARSGSKRSRPNTRVKSAEARAIQQVRDAAGRSR